MRDDLMARSHSQEQLAGQTLTCGLDCRRSLPNSARKGPTQCFSGVQLALLKFTAKPYKMQIMSVDTRIGVKNCTPFSAYLQLVAEHGIASGCVVSKSRVSLRV